MEGFPCAKNMFSTSHLFYDLILRYVSIVTTTIIIIPIYK